MQIINVSLAKAYENPDKQQNSPTVQFKQNSLTFPDFPESGNRVIARETNFLGPGDQDAASDSVSSTLGVGSLPKCICNAVYWVPAVKRLKGQTTLTRGRLLSFVDSSPTTSPTPFRYILVGAAKSTSCEPSQLHTECSKITHSNKVFWT